MRVVMNVQRTLQDAGRELVLCRDETYDLAPVVASALIATLAARPADEPIRSPERAVTAPTERKRGRAAAVAS